jgi:hypothetical protein
MERKVVLTEEEYEAILEGRLKPIRDSRIHFRTFKIKTSIRKLLRD